jgi:nickel/cobalt transporter (NiCoT) family protein
MRLNPFDDRPTRARRKIGAIYVLLAAANLSAWAWAWIAFADRPALLATALLAYVFGLRHAFDADHIAAIDNVVRKLMQDGKQPLAVGFFFSLGHSTVVVLACAAIAGADWAMQGRFGAAQAVGGVVGTAVSASFLLVIGIANLVVLRGIAAAFSRARRGEPLVDEDLDALLAGGGLLARVFRPLFGLASQSWRMYPIGFLFGLGFDTATEVGLLGISASQAHGASPWMILVFPALFTAGMSLMDTTDSVLMVGAYGWAFVNPMRKLWYNMTLTATSVVVAMFVGGVEALGLLGQRLSLVGWFWRAVAALNGNLANFGYAVVAIFIVSWIVSALIYRVGRFESVVGVAAVTWGATPR